MRMEKFPRFVFFSSSLLPLMKGHYQLLYNAVGIERERRVRRYCSPSSKAHKGFLAVRE